ncbi:MAG: LCP family protein [Caldicoprobacterales bacterium]
MVAMTKAGPIGRILNKVFGVILAIIQSVITLIFLATILNLGIIPSKYFIPMTVILLLLLGFTFYSQLSLRKSKFGKFLSIFICLILALGCYYLIKTQSLLIDISSKNTKIDDVSIIVLKEDPAQSINDTADYLFGIQEVLDRENTDKTIEKINGDLGIEMKIKAYSDLSLQVEALYGGEVDAIILNEAYRDTIKETYKDFDERTKVLTSHQIEIPVEIEPSDKEVTLEPFNVYISGIDTYGPIRRTSRSDVNIIATVNPKTKRILLTTTPRDFYVPFPITGGVRDKLTHAGVYGIDVSIGTLEDLYDIEIDYYVRVNFDSLIKMVDALGGINVDSEYAFKSGGYSFKKGINQLNGAQALAFSRERYAFASGDNQRGKNQMAVIKGMIEKAMSPAIITNYSKIMDGLSESFETNMSPNDITSLIKMQINDMSPWEVKTNNVTGKGAMKTTYTYKKKHLYVAIPDEPSVEEAKNMIKQIFEEG